MTVAMRFQAVAVPSSGMLRFVVRQTYTDVSEVFTDSIIRAMIRSLHLQRQE